MVLFAKARKLGREELRGGGDVLLMPFNYLHSQAQEIVKWLLHKVKPKEPIFNPTKTFAMENKKWGGGRG